MRARTAVAVAAVDRGYGVDGSGDRARERKPVRAPVAIAVTAIDRGHGIHGAVHRSGEADTVAVTAIDGRHAVDRAGDGAGEADRLAIAVAAAASDIKPGDTVDERVGPNGTCCSSNIG